MGRRTMLWLTAALLTFGGTGTAAVAGAGAAVRCGSIHAPVRGSDHAKVSVRVTQGQVSCRKARRVVRRYLKTSQPQATPGWYCGAGRTGTRAVAHCALVEGPVRLVGLLAR